MPDRILIIRLSALGDILHALPVLGRLREAFPQARIGWLVEPSGAPLLEGHPMLDALHIFPKKAWSENKWAALRGPLRGLADELRAERYEVAIDVQGLTKSAVWGWAAGIPRRIGFKGAQSRELAGLLATERIRPAAGLHHVVQKNLALLGALGLAQPGEIKFPVHLPEAARAAARRIVGEDPAAAPLVLMNPGAGWATKIWAPERYGALARTLVERHSVRVAMAWGPREEPLVAAALAAAGERGPVDFAAVTVPAAPGIYPLPPTRFIELGAVIERARLFVGGDTGPTHFAAALGVPTVSMMGPLDARRNGPLGPHCVTIQHAVPRPAPPWRNHKRWCDPRTDLRHVSVEEILDACEQALNLE